MQRLAHLFHKINLLIHGLLNRYLAAIGGKFPLRQERLRVIKVTGFSPETWAGGE
jgi:hypothetical protein